MVSRWLCELMECSLYKSIWTLYYDLKNRRFKSVYINMYTNILKENGGKSKDKKENTGGSKNIEKTKQQKKA